MIQAPTDMATGTVTWQIGHKGDGDVEPVRGRVTFTATTVAVPYSTATILPDQVIAYVRDGVMDSVDLLVSEPGVWAWRVQPDVGVDWPAFHVDITGDTDLATAVVTPGTGPVRMVKGETGPGIIGSVDMGDGQHIRWVLADGSLTDPVPVPPGPKGEQGPTGKSAYEYAVAAGYTGTEAEYGSAVVPSTVTWAQVTGKPATFPPSPHKHQVSDITGLQAALDAITTVPRSWSAALGVRLTTPTHEGSGQVTHPSIRYYPSSKFGARYWLALTPYPDANDAHEDPVILRSQDGITWEVPPDAPFPLDDAPGSPGTYNSDTHLTELPDGQLMVTWRAVEPGGRNVFYERHSSDGVTWTARTQIWSTTGQVLSQSLLRDGSKWWMYGVELSGSTTKLVRFEQPVNGVPTEDAWGGYMACPMVGLRPGRRLWHQETWMQGGRWWALWMDDTAGGTHPDGDLLLATSPDGHAWSTTGVPLVQRQTLDHDQLYKSTMVGDPASGSLDVFYIGYRRGNKDWRLYRTTAVAR